MVDLCADVLERVADLPDRLVLMTAEMLERAPHDSQRCPQLVARIRGELALTAQGQTLGGQRVADRDECAASVDRPESRRDEDDDGAADEKHGQDRVEG